MTWNRSGRGGWSNLGPMIAMAMASAANEWEDEFKSSRHRRKSRDWQDGARRTKRRGRMFGTGELRLALLALINEEPRHGYELIKAIEEMTGGAYAPSPGAVYPTLQMLEEEGQIKQSKPKGKGKSGDDEAPGRKREPFGQLQRLKLSEISGVGSRIDHSPHDGEQETG